ncbi:metallophosphoesterase domain containing protein [Listeria phage LMTA-148]|uniref:Metallophosphoesterase domain containing protein n=1 Tax=Listeria phage LMTA-148 TaxID=1486413 RepID=A0A068CC12_9CAUD|nr:exonuclease [Listeria phage LMTA-148]AID17439.1 metallophosphoesterase domain containing protein [Listeria phage LMTA-148]
MKNLTKAERKAIEKGHLGKTAVILGVLNASHGKIVMSQYNKIAESLGMEKVAKPDFLALNETIQEDKVLLGLYQKSSVGKITLDDLTGGSTEDKYSQFNAMTAYTVDNDKVLADLREFRKIQRDGAYTQHLFNGVKADLKKELSSIAKPKFIIKENKKKTGKEMIVALSDWHIGALVINSDTGGYDYKKLVSYLTYLLGEIAQTVEEHDIDVCHVYHIGDFIEHINMRSVNQAYEAEFNATEQISKSIRTMLDFLNVLADHVHVKFGMVGGNHDRFQGNKNEKIYNDNVAYIILDTLFLLQDSKALHSNITLIDNREDVYSFKDNVAGKNIKVVHGDTEGKKVDVKIPKHIKSEVVDYLFMGHIHTTRIVQEDYSRFHVYVGSPMGANSYSAENNLPTTQGSQLLVILSKGSNNPMFLPIFTK